MGPAERDARIQQLFLEVARVPASDRDQWLREHCDGDDQLLAEVRSLLQYDDLPVDPLESGLAFSAFVLPPGFDRTTEHPVVPGYRIVREIGTGGQAIVFEAVQESTTQRVALKMLRWGQMASVQERERLRREVVILAQLSHPGIVSIIDCGETGDGVFFIVTQYVDGHRLDELLELSATEAALFGSKSQDEYCTRVLRLFLKLCDAVDAAHRHAIVHRDLKPGNILIDRLGEPRVLDFGLAKPSIQEQLSGVDVKSITTSGQFMGSLPWASPEQAAGETVDARSDVYSLGVILYQLLSGGEFPYDVSGSMGDVITKIMHADPTPLEQVVRDSRPLPRKAWLKVELVDPALSAQVMKALTKSREDRYQTAREFREAVETYLGIDRDSDPTDKVAKRVNSKRLLFAAACGVAIVGGLLAFLHPFPNVIGRSLQDQMSSSAPDNGKSVWTSLDHKLSELADDDFITKTSEGWRIRDREVSFPEMRSDIVVLRAVLRRYSDQPVALRLRSRDGTEITIEVVHNDDNNADVVKLRKSGTGFITGQSEHPASLGGAVELALALTPDRVACAYGGGLAMQLHCRTTIGPWTPVLGAESADIDCMELQYAQPATVPPEFAVDVVPTETAAVDFVVQRGGAALSQAVSSSSENPTFHVTNLSTGNDGGPVSAGEVANIARCSRLTRLKLAYIADPSAAVEQIGKLASLTKLDIAYSHLNDDCFHELVELGQLESLDFTRTQIRNPDLAPLQRLTALKYLLITKVSVSDQDLDQLANIKSLKRISALGEEVTPQGFRSLRRLMDLYWVELPSSQVSGDGVLYLSQFPNLLRLDISGSDVCDEDIPYISQMTRLDRLTIKNTHLTRSGVEKLRESLPNCEIFADTDQ